MKSKKDEFLSEKCGSQVNRKCQVEAQGVSQVGAEQRLEWQLQAKD